jgi:predicted glycosyltransferase involved in capsule biosynthesis
MNKILDSVIQKLKEHPEKWTYKNIAWNDEIRETRYISLNDDYFEYKGDKSFLSIWTCNGFAFLKISITSFYHQENGRTAYPSLDKTCVELGFFQKIKLWYYVRPILKKLDSALVEVDKLDKEKSLKEIEDCLVGPEKDI